MVLRIAMGLLVSLRYKLRMFIVTIYDPSYIFCENQYVTKNVTLT